MENDTTVLCDTEDTNRHYFVKKDAEKYEQFSPKTCSHRTIIICLIVQGLAFGICLIVLISYVSNTTSHDINQDLRLAEYQKTAQECDLNLRLISCENAIERFTKQIERIDDIERNVYRLMGQMDNLTGSSSKQIVPPPLPTTSTTAGETLASKTAGATYVRWGRTECPESANLVYRGTAAGGKGAGSSSEPTAGRGEDVPGGGSNYLCLTNHPHFNRSESGQQPARGRIYGVEYRSGEPGPINVHHSRDAPCVFCQSKGGRSQMFMLPSSTACPDGWNKEYDGYLVSARWNHPRTEYVCLDQMPEVLPGTAATEALSHFFQVEIEITPDGGLPAAYLTGKELTCAVCTM